ncbi:hypothetical protein PSN45_002750 [Yamadazyma tenuis]|uniref:uncharacterized protein n=1 Tax=Candida tenuis TaxID=2315449 RepID=UPI00279B1498|nr:hypothetical protein PSN45_002750 [Yamadazyma tenuis]
MLFRSQVENYHPAKPLQYSKDSGEIHTMADIIAQTAPEMSHGYSYWTNPLLWSGHLQTAFTALNKFEDSDKVYYKREIISVEKDKYYEVDGHRLKYDTWEGKSTFAVDYVSTSEYDSNHLKYQPSSQTDELPPRTQYKNPNVEVFPDEERPLVVALHGLSGGSFESYVRALLNKVSPELDAVVVNSRGCAGHTITSPQLFCGVWTNDLRYFINEHVKRRWPHKKILLVGFSLGGAITANYVGQEKDDVYEKICGAFIMGSPWDFSDSSYVLRESLLGDRVYSPVMCQNLLKLLKKHHKGQLKYVEMVEKYSVDPSKFTLGHLRDFDDNFTCKLFGFNTSFEYYRHASPVQRLFKIRVPTVIVSSKDDPVCGVRSLPVEEATLNPYVTMVTTSVGGHLGWFDYSNNRWYAEPVARMMKALSEYKPVREGATLPMDIDKVWQFDRLVAE